MVAGLWTNWRLIWSRSNNSFKNIITGEVTCFKWKVCTLTSSSVQCCAGRWTDCRYSDLYALWVSNGQISQLHAASHVTDNLCWKIQLWRMVYPQFRWRNGHRATRSEALAFCTGRSRERFVLAVVGLDLSGFRVRSRRWMLSVAGVGETFTRCCTGETDHSTNYRKSLMRRWLTSWRVWFARRCCASCPTWPTSRRLLRSSSGLWRKVQPLYQSEDSVARPRRRQFLVQMTTRMIIFQNVYLVSPTVVFRDKKKLIECNMSSEIWDFTIVKYYVVVCKFYRATQLCQRVLGSRNILSVRHTRALWQNQTMHCGYFDTTRKGNHRSLAPFRLKFALRVTHPLRKTPTSTDFRL